MNDFDQWWTKSHGIKANWLHRQCFNEGFVRGQRDAMRSILRSLGVIACCFLLAGFVAALAGCQERYRYPCQDPKNWEKEECKRPLCAATQSCPDQLGKPEEIKGEVR